MNGSIIDGLLYLKKVAVQMIKDKEVLSSVIDSLDDIEKEVSGIGKKPDYYHVDFGSYERFIEGKYVDKQLLSMFETQGAKVTELYR